MYVSIVAGVKQSQETMMQVLTKMMECLDKLESARATHPSRHGFWPQQASPRRDPTGTKPPVTCLKCGKEGHYCAGGCAAPRPTQQGNWNLSVSKAGHARETLERLLLTELLLHTQLMLPYHLTVSSIDTL